MRLFFAVPLPERLKDDLAHFQAQARASGLRASWPDPQGLHVTLAFLGELDGIAVPGLMEVAQQAVSGHPAFLLKTSHLGGFPKDRAARVLWLGLEEQPALLALVDDLRKGLRAAEMPFDDKPFKAHLTVARFQTPRAVTRISELPTPMAFQVRELTLYESIQGPSGSRYSPMGVAPLGLA